MKLKNHLGYAKLKTKLSLSVAIVRITAMIAFLGKLWQFVRPYRARLFLGVFTGILAGLMAPLMIVTITLVANVMFPAPGQNRLRKNFHRSRNSRCNGCTTRASAWKAACTSIAARSFCLSR